MPLALALAPEQSQRLEALLHRVTSISLDTLLTFDELFTITGLRDKPPLYWLIIRANKELLPTKTMLVNERGLGYRKATAPDQMKHADGRRLRGTRQFRKAVTELVHVDRAQLTEHQLTALDHQVQLARMRYDTAIRKRLRAKELERQAVITQDQAFQQMADAWELIRTHWKPVK
jgi:hypothetical protein